MEIGFDTLPVILGWAALSFAVYFLLYHKFVYSIIDPLFVWVVTTAFASILAAYIIPNIQGVSNFFGCQLALWIGFLLAYRRNSYLSKRSFQNESTFSFSDQSVLRWTTYFLFLVYILSNIIIGYTKGFALLSDIPTESKIANFQEGFGLFRKINWSTGTFVSTSLIYMYLLKRRRVDLFYLIVVIFLHSVDGSKAALLQIAISAGIVLYHPYFSNKKRVLKKFARYTPVFILGVIGIFFTVLVKENDGIEDTFFAFLRRLLYSADSLLYYYQPVNIAYFEKYSSWDYISVLTNPVLGFFRLQSYHESPGNIMVENLRLPNSTATVTVGPNAPFYIEARIYFNYWVAFPFSLLVGYTYALLRTYYFSIRQSSAFYFVFVGSLCHLASAMIGDVNLAVTQSFDLAFFVVPPYLLIKLLLTNSLKLKLGPTTFNLLFK